MSDWNPSLYLHFAAERSRPAVELLARVPLENIEYIADLGCGPGNITALLHLDNTEPCQTKIRRSQCCCGRTIMVIFRRGKVALLNVIMITFSRYYLQITYKITTLTGAACGTC